MIGNLRIDLFVWWEKWVVEKPVNPMDGLRVECVGNRHDNKQRCIFGVLVVVVLLVVDRGIVLVASSSARQSEQLILLS